MKVLYLSPSFFPYRVPVFDELYQRIGAGFEVVTLDTQAQQNARVALGLGVFPRRILKGRQIPLTRLHDRGLETPFGLTLAPSLPSLLLKARPDAVISANFSLWSLTALVLGYPTIIFWEGTHHTERTVRPWRRRLRQFMVRKARGFVVNGQLARAYLESLGAPTERIHEGGLCADPPPNHFEDHVTTIDEVVSKVRFLFVGQLIERKGVSHLLQAVRQLVDKLGNNPSFEVTLVGTGPDEAGYRSMVQDLGIQDWVHFAGAASHDQVWSYYAASHVFVLPTMQDNWPLVIPEAMSMGLPLLLSRYAGSLPDLLEEGANGWAFDPRNPDDLAEQMATYVRQPTLIQSHGKHSYELVKRYTASAVADTFMNAVNFAVRGRG